MVPRETKCKYCGARILFVRDVRNGRILPVESGFVPFKWRRDGNAGAPGLFTGEGVFLPVDELPEEREAEAEGYAHRGHVCPAGARRPTKRPMSRAEQSRKEYE